MACHPQRIPASVFVFVFKAVSGSIFIQGAVEFSITSSITCTLMSFAKQLGQRYVILIIHFHMLVDAEVIQPVALRISPTLFTAP